MTKEEIEEVNKCRIYAYEIYTDSELSVFKDTEPYRKNIKAIFLDYPLIDELDIDKNPEYRCLSFRNLVYHTIEFCKENPKIKINPKTVDAIRTALLPANEALFQLLKVLYLPDESSDNYIDYLLLCRSLFFSAERYWEHYKIDTGNHDLNEMFRYLKYIKENNFDIYRRIKYKVHSIPASLVAAHLHATHKLNRHTFGDIINNMDLYLEKLDLNNIDYTKIDILNMDDLLYVKDNFDKFFQKGKVLIK